MRILLKKIIKSQGDDNDDDDGDDDGDGDGDMLEKSEFF